MDYKETLNLPKTDFPMKANLPQQEPARLEVWEAQKIYEKTQLTRKDAPLFVLHDGPPYANGDIHIGHALNKVLKDFILKSKNLSGYLVPYVPGWDCHGLPIELKVEKKTGKAGQKINFSAFREKCREYAAKQMDQQRDSFKRLGVLGDWENPYTTMNKTYEADILRALAKIIERGHLVRGNKPVHWCLDCGSALAEAEVEYKDKTSDAIDVKFPVVALTENSEKWLSKGHGPLSVVIWTTTPWTLPANEAVCLHEAIEYALVQLPNERLIMAKGLVDHLLDKAKLTDHQILATLPGKTLENAKLRHPFYEKTVPIILGEHVSLEAGTGCVHTAPAHGDLDYMVGKKYGLPVENPVGPKGQFVSGTRLFEGLHLKDANQAILEVLESNGNLLFKDVVHHSYPHCWRHKTPLIFRATPQWFISMDQNGLRESALEAIKQVDWVPSWGEERMRLMLHNRPDWCVSRQRTWGVPLALFLHKETQDLHPDSARLMQAVADQIEVDGLEAWHHLSIEAMLGEEAAKYDKCQDTLDVWFDSGISHFGVIAQDKREKAAADIYLEGSDQYRGWFQSSLLSAVAMYGKAPYKAVITHGFTVDGKGHKMSKSLGNIIEPQKVMKTYGADILRLWVASTDYQGEQTVSEDIFKRTADVYRRIRNTAKFLLSNLHDFDLNAHNVATEDLLALDYYIVAKARQLQEDIKVSYAQYNFNHVYQKMHHFCVNDLGNFYLDIIKDRQYTCKRDGLPRRSAQTAMYHVIQALTRWMMPILSFTADEIYGFLPKHKADEESVFLTTFYDGFPQPLDHPKIKKYHWEKILWVRDEVNKAIEQARNEKIIGSSLEAEVILYLSDDMRQHIQLLEDELRFVLITSEAKLHGLAEKPETAKVSSSEELWIEVNKSNFAKCERCWHRRADVDIAKEYPGLCGRCVENVAKEGEKRCYA